MTTAKDIAWAAETIAVQKRGGEGGPTLAAGEMDRLRTRIAEEFGRRRDWTYQRYDRIAPGELSRRWTPADEHHLVSNAYTFRHPDGSPAAIVGHVYDGDREDVRRGLQEKADRASLAVSFPTDTPSWWFPGETTLVLFEPAAARSTTCAPARNAQEALQ